MNRKSAVNMLLVLGAAVAMGTEAWGGRGGGETRKGQIYLREGGKRGIMDERAVGGRSLATGF